MEKAQRKMTVIRVEENKTAKQVANGFVHKLKVRVEELDRDGDPTLTYKRIPSKVKPDKLGTPYDFEIEYGTFVADNPKPEPKIYERILGFVVAEKK